MRRKPGIAGLKAQQAHRAAASNVGAGLESSQLEQTKAQLEALRAKLGEFATKHRTKINNEPQFRQAFCEMCLAAGVDPLASSKGLWNEMLGIGSFYDELAVQVVTVCLQTRDLNGGLLDLRECLQLVRRSRVGTQEVGLEDIEQAVRALAALGKGVGIRQAGGRRLVYSVPDQLSADPSAALEVAAANGGRTSATDLMQRLGWTRERAQVTCAHFIREGLCWVDDQDPSGERWCWFPSIALAAIESGAAPVAAGGAVVQSVDDFLK